MPALDVEVEESGTAVVIRLRGELDLATVDVAEQRLRTIESARAPLLLLDLRGLEFLDSTGLRMVVAADARARKDGRRLAVVRGKESVHRVFRIALLDHRLQFVDDPADLGDAAG